VLLFDGVFLMRPELRAYWDLTIYLDISADESLRRALTRDVDCSAAPTSRANATGGGTGPPRSCTATPSHRLGSPTS
jgi:hypothetical protein